MKSAFHTASDKSLGDTCKPGGEARVALPPDFCHLGKGCILNGDRNRELASILNNSQTVMGSDKVRENSVTTTTVMSYSVSLSRPPGTLAVVSTMLTGSSSLLGTRTFMATSSIMIS